MPLLLPQLLVLAQVVSLVTVSVTPVELSKCGVLVTTCASQASMGSLVPETSGCDDVASLREEL